MAKLTPRRNIATDRQKAMAPAEQSLAVTENDSADIEHPGATLFIGTGGDLHCWLFGDDVTGPVRVFKNLPNGYDTPFRVRRVAVATTCADILQIW